MTTITINKSNYHLLMGILHLSQVTKIIPSSSGPQKKVGQCCCENPLYSAVPEGYRFNFSTDSLHYIKETLGEKGYGIVMKASYRMAEQSFDARLSHCIKMESFSRLLKK